MVIKRLIIIALLLSFSVVSQATITLKIDRDDISLSESFKLFFESDASVDDDPDFSPLEVYFSILGRSQSSSTSIINGSFSSTKTWVLTLMPKQAGKITIPAISFGSDKSTPSILTVNARSNAPTSSNDKDIFIEAEVEDKAPIIGQQVLLKVKIYTRLQISSAQLSEPRTVGFESEFQQLGQTARYSSVVGGKNYTVLQQNYLFTPQTAGQGTLEPIIFQADTGRGSNRIFSPFDQGERIKLQTAPVVISIAAEPSTPHQLWIPAKALKISSQIANGPYKVGEPINLTIVIEAKNQIAELLPLLPLAKQTGFKSYADKPIFENSPTKDGIDGRLTQKYAIIPQKEGLINLPEYTVQWWNTETNRFETSKIPARQIKVTAAQAQMADRTRDNNDVVVAPINLPVNQNNHSTNESLLPWQLLSLAFFILWLATLIYHLANKNTAPKTAVNVKAVKNNSKKLLLTACQNNNAKQSQKYLIEWAQGIFEDESISNIQQIKQRVSKDFAIEIDALQHALYSEQKNNWNGLKLASEVKNVQISKTATEDKKGLKNLYPD